MNRMTESTRPLPARKDLISEVKPLWDLPEPFMSPTARTIKKLRDEGWTPDVVERWIPGANIRRDLYGWIDVLAIKDTETKAIQCTSRSNMASRVRKIEDSSTVDAVRKAGWSIEVWGWYQTKGKGTGWQVKITDCS